MSEKIVQLNEDVIKGQLKELVRGRFRNPFLREALAMVEFGNPLPKYIKEPPPTSGRWL